MTQEQLKALAMRVSNKGKMKAQMLQFFPAMADMSEGFLSRIGFEKDAITLMKHVRNMSEEELASLPEMNGFSSSHTSPGWRTVAKKPIKRFFSQLAALDAFSTTYSEDFIPPGTKDQLAELVVDIYDDSGEADIDNFAPFSSRDSGCSSHTTVLLHQVDTVTKIYARNLAKGVNPEIQLEAAVSRVAKKVMRFVLQCCAEGTAQADNEDVTVEAITLPAPGPDEGQYNFGYVNQVLSEAIQPEVHSMLVDSTHYGKLKKKDGDSLTMADLDIEYVKKIQHTEELGTNACGLLANKRGVVVGFAAPSFIDGAYASVTQLQNGELGFPLTVATYFDPDNNCMVMVVGTLVGVKITDASAVKVLKTAAASTPGESTADV